MRRAWLPLAAALVANPASSQQLFQPPTATEAFQLRALCVKLGNGLLEKSLVGSALTKSANTNYQARTNRCYVDIVVQSIDPKLGYTNRSLFDAQTEEVLAFAKIEKGKRVGMVFGQANRPMGDDLGFSDANEYIDKIMAAER